MDVLGMPLFLETPTSYAISFFSVVRFGVVVGWKLSSEYFLEQILNNIWEVQQRPLGIWVKSYYTPSIVGSMNSSIMRMLYQPSNILEWFLISRLICWFVAMLHDFMLKCNGGILGVYPSIIYQMVAANIAWIQKITGMLEMGWQYQLFSQWMWFCDEYLDFFVTFGLDWQRFFISSNCSCSATNTQQTIQIWDPIGSYTLTCFLDYHFQLLC